MRGSRKSGKDRTDGQFDRKGLERSHHVGVSSLRLSPSATLVPRVVAVWGPFVNPTIIVEVSYLHDRGSSLENTSILENSEGASQP